MPRAEMGQGVHTTLAALVAEDLDLPWQSVRTLHGPTSEAYFNAAMLEAAVLHYPSWKRSWLAEGLRYATVVANPYLRGTRAGFGANRARVMRGVSADIDLGPSQGDALAVVADNCWRAFRAAAALEIDWRPAAGINGDSSAMLDRIAASIDRLGPDAVARDDGDVEQALQIARAASQPVVWPSTARPSSPTPRRAAPRPLPGDPGTHSGERRRAHWRRQTRRSAVETGAGQRHLRGYRETHPRVFV